MNKLSKLIRLLESLVYLFFYTLYSIYAKIRTIKKDKIVGISSDWLEGNLYSIYTALRKRGYEVFWVAWRNKEFLEYAKRKGIKCYYEFDLKRIPLFYRTKVWLGTPGFLSLNPKYFRGGVWIEMNHGMDISDSLRKKTHLRHLKRVSYIFASSEFVKEMYVKAGIDGKKIVVTGFPRTDILVNCDANKIRIAKSNFLSELGFMDERKKRKVVLYAPTWGYKKYEFLPGVPLDKKFFKLINEFCKRKKFVFVVRFHKNIPKELVHRVKKICDEFPYVLVDDFVIHPLAETVLLASDILITDFSSIFFEFLLLERPIIFLEKPRPTNRIKATIRENTRIVGYRVKNLKELFELLASSELRNYKKKFGKAIREVKDMGFGDHADGRATARAVNKIIALLENDTRS